MKQLSGADLLELHARTGSGGPALLLLDVREPWEVAVASIRVDGATHLDVPMRSLADRLDAIDPAQPVVCICHHGTRSAQVVAFLERLGYGSVYNLAGGIDAWSQQVDPCVSRY